MHGGRGAFFILAVMLLAPLAGAVDNKQPVEDNILDKAAGNWHAMEPSDSVQSPLKVTNNLIHLAIGSFDPLVDDLPKSRLDDNQDFRNTGMAIIQLNQHTGNALYEIVESNPINTSYVILNDLILYISLAMHILC